MKTGLLVLLAIGVVVMAVFSARAGGGVDYLNFPAPKVDLDAGAGAGPQTVVLAGGCFWCVEGVFEQIPGVTNAVSGYAGGTAETADYEKICSGQTDHAESVKVTYDPAKVSFGQILKVFFSVAHDPTTLNRQGNDVGRQYRSVIFFADEKQKAVSEAYIKQLNDAKVFAGPIVTSLEPLVKFFPAEEYHQDYARLNPNQGYIQSVAVPKIQKACALVQAARGTMGGSQSEPATKPAH